MLIKIFTFLAGFVPESWKKQIKLILHSVYLDVEKTRDLQSSVPSNTRKPAGSLLEYYGHRIGTLDFRDAGFLNSFEEIRDIRKILKLRYPPQLLKAGPAEKRPWVSIIIPVYSNHSDLKALLESLETAANFRDFEIIVVNDNPMDPLPPEISGEDFAVTILQNRWNAGYSMSNNWGGEYAKGEFLLFLNSDILPKREDWVDRMLQTMDERDGTGIVGAKTLYHGTQTIEHFGMYPIYDFQIRRWNNAHYFHRIEDGLFSETSIDQEVDMVTGAALLMRTELFERLGGFNEAFIIGGFEDSDLCRRVRDAGYGIRVSSACVLEHKKSVSLKESGVYTETIARCNQEYYHHLWAETLSRQDSLHHAFRRAGNKKRVLFVAHGYPPESVGGTELYNKYLAEAVADIDGFESVILARKCEGPLDKDGEIVFDAGVSGSVPVFGCFRFQTSFLNAHPRAELEFEMFLHSIRPDAVHFNHTENLSANFVKIAKRCIDGPVIYTLHEFLPICANYGLMVMSDGSLCAGAELKKCAGCVRVKEEEIEKRRTLYRDNFSYVDIFIAPSRQLKEKYAQWGLDPQRIRHARNGIVHVRRQQQKETGSKRKFCYLGQLLPHKGIHLLLDAVQILNRSMSGKFEIHVHGDFPNLKEFEAFKQRTLRRMKSLQPIVTFHGPFPNEKTMNILGEADALVVPSTWWENSPLTIQEAFLAGVPVITANIGGMKELVQDGCQGLLFEVGNAADLAAKMRTLIEKPELLRVFHANLRKEPVKSMAENAKELAQTYAVNSPVGAA